LTLTAGVWGKTKQTLGAKNSALTGKTEEKKVNRFGRCGFEGEKRVSSHNNRKGKREQAGRIQIAKKAKEER